MSLAAEQRFERIVAGDSLSGAFFFHGDAGKLRDEAARQLADAALEPATRDFNFDAYRGADVSPESLAAALAMAPMMAPRRVVVLYEAERLTPKGCKVVEGVLESFPDDLTLIITATIPDRSKKAFYRRLKDGALSIEWSAPREAEVPGWLIERAERRYGGKTGRRRRGRPRFRGRNRPWPAGCRARQAGRGPRPTVKWNWNRSGNWFLTSGT